MENSDFIKLILTSSLIGVIISTLVNWLIIPRINYRNEYYKKIIDKKLDAYASVDDFITYIQHHNYNSFRKEFVSMGFYSMKNFGDMGSSAVKVMNKSFWLERNTLNAFEDINSFVAACYEVLKTVHESNYNNKLNDIYIKNQERINELCNKLALAVLNDYREMSNIKSFLSKKKIRVKTGKNIKTTVLD